MNEDDIRALIRDAIARHLGPAEPLESPHAHQHAHTHQQGMSFHRYALPRAADDVMCLIEPAVRCNHCGYCQCHGH